MSINVGTAAKIGFNYAVHVVAAAFAAGLVLASAPSLAQHHAGPKVLAEKKVASLPQGALYWRVDNFRTVAAAKAVAGANGLVAEAAGKVWLFTLGPASMTLAAGGTKVAEIGPLPPVKAAQYLLQVREAKTPPGQSSPVHTHPGSEAFYVLSGEQTLISAVNARHAKAGQSMIGPEGGSAMQVANEGTGELHMLVMFVLDAGKPFSSPADFH